jgi:ApaG protein
LNENEIVDGEVIGKKPVFKEGEQHNYSSGCLLSCLMEQMKGHLI